MKWQDGGTKPIKGDPDADVLTLAEAAAYLRLHKRTVLVAVRRGQMPGRKVAGRWRFLRADLIAFLKERPGEYTESTW